MIARDYLVNDRPDAVILSVDAAKLERNLYLVIQILEVGLPTNVVLNMVDVAKSRDITVDVDRLVVRLGATVLTTVARRGEGLEALKAAVVGLVTMEHAS